MGCMDGRTVAITGAAGGIGGATVRRFVEEGGRVAFCDLDTEKGAVLEKELGADSASFTVADVSKESDCVRFIDGAVSRFGRLDVLVNNAAVRNYEDVTEASTESWDNVLGVNLRSYIYCAKAGIAAMKRTGGGVVVNVASVRSLRAGSRCVQYDTTKAAILGLNRSMARDHAADNIRVMAVGPGPVFTDFHQARAESMGKTHEEYRRNFGGGTMLRRPGEPVEVANVILFLASDEASFMTGTCVYVDGGETGMGMS